MNKTPTCPAHTCSMCATNGQTECTHARLTHAQCVLRMVRQNARMLGSHMPNVCHEWSDRMHACSAHTCTMCATNGQTEGPQSPLQVSIDTQLIQAQFHTLLIDCTTQVCYWYHASSQPRSTNRSRQQLVQSLVYDMSIYV